MVNFRLPLDIDLRKIAQENGFTIKGMVLVALKEFWDKRNIKY
jgi:hypothetical protein